MPVISFRREAWDMVIFILACIWQLPQHLLGLILWGFFAIIGKVTMIERNGVLLNTTINSTGIGVSLGFIIIMDARYSDTELKHETGHTVQSLMFGPLYLLVVGIPSAIFNNLWDRLFHKKWGVRDRIKWYYSRYPEKWADELGGVVRW